MKLQTCIVIGLLVFVCCCSTVLAEKPAVSAERDNSQFDLATAYPNYAIYWSPSTFFVPFWSDYQHATFPERGALYYGDDGAYVNIEGGSEVEPMIGVSMPAYLTGSYVLKARHVYLHYKLYSTYLHPTRVQVYNGPTLVFTKDYPSTGWAANTVYLDDIDMGFYSVFNRGFRMKVYLKNYDTTYDRVLYLYGAGVRAEW
jgi:hypothetical protein